MFVLVFRLNYKCYWDEGLFHVFLIDGIQFTIED